MLASGISLQLESSGGLKRSVARAGMFRAKSKDHGGPHRKGHDRTASVVPERRGLWINLPTYGGQVAGTPILIS